MCGVTCLNELDRATAEGLSCQLNFNVAQHYQ
jgi:hypothetical protein